MPSPVIGRALLASCCCLLLLGGCLGTASPNPQVPVDDRSGSGSASSSQAGSETGSTQRRSGLGDQAEAGSGQPHNPGKANVTLALLEKSATAQRAGEHQQAVTFVERAIRINPRRATLWVQLAQLQLALENPTAAQEYAQKAITLAGPRLDWIRDAWLVIADAKQALGQSQEADAIRLRWQTAKG